MIADHSFLRRFRKGPKCKSNDFILKRACSCLRCFSFCGVFSSSCSDAFLASCSNSFLLMPRYGGLKMAYFVISYSRQNTLDQSGITVLRVGRAFQPCVLLDDLSCH